MAFSASFAPSGSWTASNSGALVAARDQLRRELGHHHRRLALALIVFVSGRGAQVGAGVGVLRRVVRRRGILDVPVGPVLGAGLGPLPLDVDYAVVGVGDPGGEPGVGLGPPRRQVTLPASSTLVTSTVTVSDSILRSSRPWPGHPPRRCCPCWRPPGSRSWGSSQSAAPRPQW